jgi:carbamoyltransferase
MLVLGLNYGDHDPSAALVEDGRLLIAVEHERVSRTKRAKFQLPTESVLACLQATGAAARDVDVIAVGWSDQMLGELSASDIRYRLENVLPGEFSRLPALPPLVGVRHHLAHAASAFWCSGFDECAVLVTDGEGEDEATTLWWGKPDGLEELATFPPALSLGHFYKSATKYAGLEQDGGNHEGKLMGLAAYGRPTEPMPLGVEESGPVLVEEIVSPAGTRIRESLRDQMHEYWRRNTYPFVLGNGREIMAYANFAASVQDTLERALIQLAGRLRVTTRSNALAIAGGVGQNCAANGILAAAGLFEKMYVQPACHDAGVSIGAALQVSHERDRERDLRRTAKMPHAYWGLRYSADECQAALDNAGLKYRHLPEGDLVQAVAQLIADDHIVGWFHGAAEIGPRALGARSILADPRKRPNVIRVNDLKSREIWRPLAPSVLEEYFDQYFIAPVRSPFMNVACKVSDAARQRVPAVVHVDGTARPQVVSKEHSPRFWALIDAFRSRTETPVLLNTSFNLRGEPIVHTPRNAIRDFQFSSLDVLVLENYLVTKEMQS